MARYSRRRGGEDGDVESEKKDLEASAPVAETSSSEGGRRRRSRKTMRVPKGVHVKAKTLKRLLRSKGLKVSGKKSTLRARARKAHLIRGGMQSSNGTAEDWAPAGGK